MVPTLWQDIWPRVDLDTFTRTNGAVSGIIKQKKYVNLLDTPANDNFNYILELKKQHLNSE